MSQIVVLMNCRYFLLLAFVLFITSSYSVAQEGFIVGDPLPDAPELALRGEHTVGVRTMGVTNGNQLDLLNSDSLDVHYDRSLILEIWYPAELTSNQKEEILYDQVMGMAGNKDRPNIPFQFTGRAARDAKIKATDQAYPLIVVSHGYPGSRYLMTYLCENLASKGYVVVAIDHTESTFSDADAFVSTLLNRAIDIHFVIDEITNFSDKQSDHFLAGHINTDQIGIVGYSMGGYGVLNVGGAGYSERLAGFFKQNTKGNSAIDQLLAGSDAHHNMFDERIKAIVAFAPWGMSFGVWDSLGLTGLKIPTLFIAGSEDDISGYEDGVKAIFDGSHNTNRYMLTYLNARHNVAPNAPPSTTFNNNLHFDEYYRYAEPGWDQRRLNNINQHFVTAFMGSRLKNQDLDKYLNVKNVSSNKQEWPGFKARTCVGMELRFSGKKE